MPKYFIHLKGNLSAYGPVEADSKEDAKQWMRDWLNVKRLPNGTVIWLTK